MPTIKAAVCHAFGTPSGIRDGDLWMVQTSTGDGDGGFRGRWPWDDWLKNGR